MIRVCSLLLITVLAAPALAQQAAAPPTLDQVLERVRGNFEAYVAAIPNVYADEHVDSRMESHPQELGEAMTRTTFTDSTFRLTRLEDPDFPLRLTEQREVRAIDKKPVPAGKPIAGPVVIQGAFGYGVSVLSPALKQCYDYRLLSPQKLHGVSVLVVEYTSKATPAKTWDFTCPVDEPHSGRAFLDPESLQVVRLEQRRPRHMLEGGVYNTFGNIGTFIIDSSQLSSRNPSGSADLASMEDSAARATAVKIPTGTPSAWNWAIDYAPVTLDGKKFWLPKSIHSTTATIGSVTLVQWTYTADYGDYHLMTAHSTILPAAQK